MKPREYAVAAAVSIGIATVLRLWKVADPATLNLHVIRQMIGAMQARNMALGVTSWFKPAIDVAWLPSDPPWFMSLEFPLVPWITAALYRAFGTHIWFGNVLSILFSACAAWVFYLIARRLLKSELMSLAVLLPFLFLPEAYKYSRLIQPDSLSMLSLLFTIYGALRFVEAESTDGDFTSVARRRWFALTLLGLAVMLLNKVNYAPLALVPAGVVVVGLGWRRLLARDMLIALPLAVLPAALWYVWSSRAAEFDQFGVVVQNSVLLKLLENWRDPLFWGAVSQGVQGWLFLPGVVLVGVGFVIATRNARNSEDRILVLWAAATFVYLYVVGPDLLAPHRYYFLPVLPVAALLMGRFGTWLLGCWPSLDTSGRPAFVALVAALLSGVLAVGSWWMLRGYYAETHAEMMVYSKAGEMIRANTQTDDLLDFETEDWGVTLYIAYVAERRGWTYLDDSGRAEVIKLGATYAFVSSAPYAEKYLNTAEEAAVLDARRASTEADSVRIAGSDEYGTLFRLKDEAKAPR